MQTMLKLLVKYVYKRLREFIIFFINLQCKVKTLTPLARNYPMTAAWAPG